MSDNGYRRPELWREPFLKDGQELTFAAAMQHFRDATGRPGPATWEMGGYIAGTDDHPVAGVSWYEAAAYARWAGKSLPTLYHWSRAADPYLSADVVPVSNFSGKSLLPVGAAAGITRGGTIDMAGNVREWCLTAAGTRRYIAGGAWNDATYIFSTSEAQSPFARDATNGFRCIKWIGRTISPLHSRPRSTSRHATYGRRGPSASRCLRRGATCRIPSTMRTCTQR